MSTKHFSSARVAAVPALGAMLLLLLASSQAQASSVRHAQARGAVTSVQTSGLRDIRAADKRMRGNTFQTHC